VSPRRSAVVLILLALVAAGCGHQSSERPAVARYVKQVNTIEAALAAPLASVTSAGNAFSRQQRSGGYVLSQRPAGKSILVLGPSPEQTLQKALTGIRALRARLAAVGAPPAAGHLRVLGPATRQLETVLSRRTAYGAAAVSAVFATKAAALRRFQATTHALVVQLHRLRPPPVSRPGYVAEVTALRGMGASAGRLAAMLASGGSANVGPVLAQFDRAAGNGDTLAVQRAEIAATRAYDSRVSALDALSQKVTVERLQLSNTLK